MSPAAPKTLPTVVKKDSCSTWIVERKEPNWKLVDHRQREDLDPCELQARVLGGELKCS
jgi:hypothetical protein